MRKRCQQEVKTIPKSKPTSNKVIHDNKVLEHTLNKNKIKATKHHRLVAFFVSIVSTHSTIPPLRKSELKSTTKNAFLSPIPSIDSNIRTSCNYDAENL
jgi:hypothetical protein